jgi:hypothetical protein
LVREPLIWLGKADPVASREIVRHTDPALGTLLDAMEGWKHVVGLFVPKTALDPAYKEVRNRRNRRAQGPVHPAASSIAKCRRGESEETIRPAFVGLMASANNRAHPQ